MYSSHCHNTLQIQHSNMPYSLQCTMFSNQKITYPFLVAVCKTKLCLNDPVLLHIELLNNLGRCIYTHATSSFVSAHLPPP